jgi:hypothetical protein
MRIVKLKKASYYQSSSIEYYAETQITYTITYQALQIVHRNSHIRAELEFAEQLRIYTHIPNHHKRKHERH